MLLIDSDTYMSLFDEEAVAQQPWSGPPLPSFSNLDDCK